MAYDEAMADKLLAKEDGEPARMQRLQKSDLLGVAVTAYTFLVLVLAFVVFRVGGGVGGMIVIVGAWVPMVLFVIRRRDKPPLSIDVPGEGPRHRVLVVANRGLEHDALYDEVRRRADRIEIEAMIIAPVVAQSRVAQLTDDVDHELEAAEERLSVALAKLRDAGVKVEGRTDIADPMQVLVDGLRQFPPNEVVILPPDHESDQDLAADMSRRVRHEIGLPVTVIESTGTT